MTKKTNNHKFQKFLWAGKNTEDGSISYNWMYRFKKDADKAFKEEEHYEIVRVELREI